MLGFHPVLVNWLRVWRIQVHVHWTLVHIYRGIHVYVHWTLVHVQVLVHIHIHRTLIYVVMRIHLDIHWALVNVHWWVHIDVDRTCVHIGLQVYSALNYILRSAQPHTYSYARLVEISFLLQIYPLEKLLNRIWSLPGILLIAHLFVNTLNHCLSQGKTSTLTFAYELPFFGGV